MAACVAKTSAACVKRVKVPVEPSTEASLLAASLGTSDFCDEKIFDAWIGSTEINVNQIFVPLNTKTSFNHIYLDLPRGAGL